MSVIVLTIAVGRVAIATSGTIESVTRIVRRLVELRAMPIVIAGWLVMPSVAISPIVGVVLGCSIFPSAIY